MDAISPSLFSFLARVFPGGSDRKDSVAGAVEDSVLLFGCEFLPRRLEVESEVLGNRFGNCFFCCTVSPVERSPQSDGTFHDGERIIGDN